MFTSWQWWISRKQFFKTSKETLLHSIIIDIKTAPKSKTISFHELVDLSWVHSFCQVFNNLTVYSFNFQYFLSIYHLSHIFIQTVWISKFNCAANADGRSFSCVYSVRAADVFCAEIYVAVQWIMKIPRYWSHTMSTLFELQLWLAYSNWMFHSYWAHWMV